MKNKIPSYVLICCTFVAAFCFVLLFALSRPVNSKNSGEQIRIEIPGGTSTKAISQLLKNNKLVRSSNFFYLTARRPVVFFRFRPFVLKSGVYHFNQGMSVKQILDLLESGKQEFIKTSIPEGLTMKKIAVLLENNGVCNYDDFMQACNSKELLSAYNIEAENFEGLLFPDTYFFTPYMKGTQVVKIMVDNFFDKIKQIPSLEGKSVQEIYKTLILASIVEREYRVASEAPYIASVFVNRMQDNVGFYSCATIEYIITEILDRPHPDVITFADLKIDSPYNTYKWAGLTPGPISNPGMVALNAAANPPVTDYYYFTLTDAQKGTHTFSKSFNSHIKAGTQFKTKKAASN